MALSKEAREAKAAYMKKWRQSNQDKVKKHQETYWAKVAEKMKQEQQG